MMDISSDIKCCRAANTCFKTWKKVRRRCIQEQVEDRELVKVLYSAYRSRTATSRLVPECIASPFAAHHGPVEFNVGRSLPQRHSCKFSGSPAWASDAVTGILNLCSFQLCVRKLKPAWVVLERSPPPRWQPGGRQEPTAMLQAAASCRLRPSPRSLLPSLG